MSEQKKNDILEEQRRARQGFLELKKMQRGEIEAKPYEAARVPTTPKEEIANFWFHYKWHTVGIIATAVILAIMITQCVTKTKYDFEVVYFTYTTAMDGQTELIADYIEKYVDDINGDGEVNVQIINCSFTKSSNNSQLEYSCITKMQAVMAGDQNALLFITDSESYGYFDNISSEDGIFENEPLQLGEDFYNATESEQYGNLPEGLQISCRRVKNTVLENKKGVNKIYEVSQKVLKALGE